MALINVIHPGLPPASASLQEEAAFEATWKSKGWIKISAEDAATHNQAVEDGGPSPVLDALGKSSSKGGDK